MSQLNAILLRISAAGLLVVMSALVHEALKQATLGQAIFLALALVASGDCYVCKGTGSLAA